MILKLKILILQQIMKTSKTLLKIKEDLYMLTGMELQKLKKKLKKKRKQQLDVFLLT